MKSNAEKKTRAHNQICGLIDKKNVQKNTVK